MLTALWSMKGGVGTSTTAALAAVGASAGQPALLVDMGRDQTVLFACGNSVAGIAEWSWEHPYSADLRAKEVQVSATLSLVDRGWHDIKPGRAHDLVELLGAEDRPVIVDAGPLDPFARGAGPDIHLRRAVVEAADMSLLVSTRSYLAMRKAPFNLVRADGVVMVDAAHPMPYGAAHLDEVYDRPVVATVPHDENLATAPGVVAMTAHGWKKAAEDLRELTAPRASRIDNAAAANRDPAPWCPWWTAGQRKEFCHAASWAIESLCGPHHLDADTGTVQVQHPPAEWSLATAAQYARDNATRPQWRRELWHEIGGLRGEDMIAGTGAAGAEIGL